MTTTVAMTRAASFKKKRDIPPSNQKQQEEILLIWMLRSCIVRPTLKAICPPDVFSAFQWSFCVTRVGYKMFFFSSSCRALEALTVINVLSSVNYFQSVREQVKSKKPDVFGKQTKQAPKQANTKKPPTEKTSEN